MARRKIRFELTLGMTEQDQKRMRNHLNDLLRDAVLEDLTINKYNIEITFNGSHAGAYDMEAIKEDLQDWQNDNIMLTEDEMLA